MLSSFLIINNLNLLGFENSNAKIDAGSSLSSAVLIMVDQNFFGSTVVTMSTRTGGIFSVRLLWLKGQDGIWS